MTIGRVQVWLVMTLWVSMQLFPLMADAGGSAPDASADTSAAKLLERMDRLENRVTDLETQVATLKREKSEALDSLKRQQDADAKLQAQVASQHASATDPPPESGPGDERPQRALLSSYGVRAGYQGFPFGQKEGGFYYGVFLDHTLVQHSDGMPAGDLDFEVGAGVARSGNDKLVVNSTVVGAPTTVDFRQRMISVWPDLKYRFNLWQAYGFKPYLTGGPGIWVDIIETPPLVGGLQFPTPELGARKIPAIAGASLFEGGQGGAGFELSLARLGPTIFERMKLGFDYRYSAWTTGQRFSTYSLLLSYSD